MRTKRRRFLLYLLLRVGMWVVRIMPRRWALGLGRTLGFLAFFVIPKYRKRTLRHLEQAWGEAKERSEIRQIGRKVFEHLGLTAVDVILFPRLNPQKLQSWVFENGGFRLVRELVSQGKGVIMVSAHLGNWELLAGYFAMMGYHGSVVGRRIYYDRYDRILVNLRRSLGVETIYRDSSPKKVLEVLKRGEILGLVTDQDVDSIDGVFVNFFSRPAYTPSAPAKLALATGAPILPAFLIRKGFRYELIVEDPIYPNPEADREEEILRLTEAWSESFEKQIRRFPEQWVWMHDRWKTQPKNSEEFSPQGAGSVISKV